MIEHIVASSTRGVSPRYQSYKSRVEADGGTVALTEEQMREMFETFRHFPYWIFMASGKKNGRLYTIFPNTAAGDILFSRNSKATVMNNQGKLVEVLAEAPAFEYDQAGDLLGVNISSQGTNYIANSSTTFYAGSNAALLESPYVWSFTSLYTHSRYFPEDGQTRRAFKQATVTAGNTYCFSCFVKMDDGSAPQPSIDFNIHLSAQIVPIANTGVIHIINDIYLVYGYATYMEASNLHGIQRNPAPQNTGKALRAVGFQLNEGAFPLRHVVTTNAIVTKLFDNTETAQVLPMNNIVLFAEMKNNVAMGASNTPLGFIIRLNSTNYITIGYTSAGVAGMAIVSGGVVVLQINGIAASGKIAARFKDGEFALAVNGVLYDEITIGSQDYINNFTNSATVQLGHMNRNITVKQAAVLAAGTNQSLIQLTI